MTYDFDLLVIGAGSGGVRTARMSAGQGKKVAVVESRYLGGTCVNVGCVPKKLFVYGSEITPHSHDAKDYGFTHGPMTFDWATLRDNKTREISRLNGIYNSLLENSGCTLIDGHARFINDNTVEVNGKEYTAEKILIATGTWPSMPEIEGADLAISSNEFFFLPKFPDDVVIVGGGYIAVEFSGICNGLGAKTHLIYRGTQLLKSFDHECGAFATQELIKKGIDIQFEQNINAIKQLDNGKKQVTYTDGTTAETDLVIFATGRNACIDGLGLENTSVTLNKRGFIEADDFFQTKSSSVFALGDVICTPQLTPVALAQGMALTKQICEGIKQSVDYTNIPTAIFCQPNLGTVGLSEEDAIDQGFDVSIFTSEFKALKHTITQNTERTLMKLVVDKASDKVLGVHMVGAEAGETIQGFAVALKAGATKAIFDSTIGIHPTGAEEFVTMRTANR
jgi:glutathione reductase (NADPH)